MIGRLHGVLLEKQAPFLLLDVQGVGYELEAPMSTFYDLPDVGAKLTLYTHLHVREDAQILYAFYAETERRLFRYLIKINGVGAKLALTILSGFPVDEFILHIESEDLTALTRLPGVGKKTAGRLVMEMRDRIAKWDLSSATSVAGGQSRGSAASVMSDAVDALVSLGYKEADANKMVRAVDGEGLSSEEIIRQALQGIVK
ncbi:MAG: Holliday junction branch migration protein RuvA [Gammaproteobacteria bacterium]|nr:Holliday junction branch migration protein RuvA [Gammaproteobacteria bacterium]